MSTTSNPRVKLIGLIIIIAGAFMFVAGGLTWGVVSTQLKAENISVAKVTEKDPGSLAGKSIAGPITAYAQINAINYHTLDAAKGRTFADLGADARVLKAKLAAGGMSKADIATNKDVVALAELRTSTMNGSLLRASLFTSLVSFGVAALVMGLGLLFALLGFALTRIAKSATLVTASVPAKVKGRTVVPSGAKA